LPGWEDRFGDRVAGVELPPEQVAVVAPELRRVSTDDLEVHNWLSHGESLPRRLSGRRLKAIYLISI
jgi:hypothetical protein